MAMKNRVMVGTAIGAGLLLSACGSDVTVTGLRNNYWGPDISANIETRIDANTKVVHSDYYGHTENNGKHILHSVSKMLSKTVPDKDIEGYSEETLYYADTILTKNKKEVGVSTPTCQEKGNSGDDILVEGVLGAHRGPNTCKVIDADSTEGKKLQTEYDGLLRQTKN